MPEIVIQAVGVAMEEALLVRWLKQPGDSIAIDDIVAEIDTDKASMDVVSPYAGTLGPHLAAEGEVVPVGAAIVLVLDGTEEQVTTPAQGAPVAASARDEQPAPAEGAEAPRRSEDGAAEPHRLSPRARRLAAQARDAAAAAGGDAATAAGGDTPAAPPENGAGRFRELIASKVAESWREIPHFTVSREVAAGALNARLKALRDEAFDPAPTLTDLLLVALAVAVGDSGSEAQVDLGLAVATEDGVVIPVVRDVLGQTPAELARSRQSAIARARAGKLSQEDLAAAPPSTLSNLGAFGVDRFTGIVALGQTSLLTVGRVLPRAVADEHGEIGVQLMFDATLNADHRAVDGAEAARLLVAFATAAETMTPTTEKGN
jgi:pyruvate dehydrogenase E2 component (dihydrolipoamide acetyltransferase)